MVILGDAFTGHVNPLLVLVSLATACLGLAGLVHEVRVHRRDHPAEPPTDGQPSEPVINAG